jgi:predicted nucleic acid-binding protein
VKVLVDANVCLDVLLGRVPFGESSAKIWSLVEEGTLEGVVPAHAVTTVHYLVSKERDRVTGRRFVADFMRVFRVAAVTETVLKRALELDFADFEDAVCSAAAEEAGCELVVTRNRKDFVSSPVTAVDPITALALLEDRGSSGVSERPGAYRSRQGKTVSARRHAGRGVARAKR